MPNHHKEAQRNSDGNQAKEDGTPKEGDVTAIVGGGILLLGLERVSNLGVLGRSRHVRL